MRVIGYREYSRQVEPDPGETAERYSADVTVPNGAIGLFASSAGDKLGHKVSTGWLARYWCWMKPD
jgi:hypothetical protein